MSSSNSHARYKPLHHRSISSPAVELEDGKIDDLEVKSPKPYRDDDSVDDDEVLLEPLTTYHSHPIARSSPFVATSLRSSCIAATVAVFALIIGLVAAGGYYVFHPKIKDGLSPAWYPTPRGGTVPSWQDSYAKAAKLVNKMSLVEKANITTGQGWSQGLCVGNTAPALEAGFPSLCLQDGPLGLRFTDHATSFPAGITVGATWNRELMHRRGMVHARQAKMKGVNVLLGPVSAFLIP
jgi:hypothetical protein